MLAKIAITHSDVLICILVLEEWLSAIFIFVWLWVRRGYHNIHRTKPANSADCMVENGVISRH